MYIGDGNNICHSLMQIGVKLGMKITVSSPAGYEPFQGIVDLITMKAIIYRAEDLGAESETIDIPAELLDRARAQREKMIEIVAEMDDELTHKYLEGHTLSPEDIKRGLRLGR